MYVFWESTAVFHKIRHFQFHFRKQSDSRDLVFFDPSISTLLCTTRRWLEQSLTYNVSLVGDTADLDVLDVFDPLIVP